MVFILEGLTVGVDSHQADLGCVEGVDAQVGCAARMGLFADVADQFAHKAVAGTAADALDTGAIKGGGVLHNHNVDVIEHAQFDKLLFAAQEPDLSSLFQLVAVFDLHVLLSGDSHQHNVAGEFFHNAGAGEGIADANQAGTHAVMAAGVGSAGFFVGAAVAGGNYRIHFAHDSDPDFGFFALQGGDYTGDGHAILVFVAHLIKGLFDLFRGFELLVAQLGLAEDGIAQGDDLIPIFVNGFACSSLEFLFGYRHNLNLPFLFYLYNSHG